MLRIKWNFNIVYFTLLIVSCVAIYVLRHGASANLNRKNIIESNYLITQSLGKTPTLRFIIVLTMTIDPKNTILTARNNISERINDYRKSLARWKELPYKVVAIESSGYGNPFEDILQNAYNIQYISKLLPHIPKKGKGYGEAQTLKYLVDHDIDDDTYIIKITGRYAPFYSENLSKILNILEKKQPNILIKYNNIKRDQHQYRSEWLVMKKKFLKEFVKFVIKNGDDRKGLSGIFETQLKNFVKNVKNVQYTDLSIKVLPTYRGTGNEFMDSI